MGIFDSSSSSTTQNFSEETTIDKTTGFQDAGGVVALGEQSGFGNQVRVNVLDAGAISGGLSVAAKSVDGAFNLSTEVVRNLITSQDRNIGKALQFAEDSSRSSNEFAASVANPNQEVQKDIVKNVVIGVSVLSVALGLAYMGMKK